MGKTEADLIDHLIEFLDVKNDRHLAQALGMTQQQMSRIRSRTTPVSAGRVLVIHEITGWPINKIKSFLTHGDQILKVK